MSKLRLLLMSALLAVSLGAVLPASASALSGSDFNPGRIIDDAVFFNPSGMSSDQIQAFLNSKVPACDTNHARSGSGNDSGPPYTCLKSFSQNTPSKPAEAGLCSALPAKSGRSASGIIYDVAQACGINPKVLIVMLQKEQSLITDTWPWNIQYDRAMGYGCPDSGPNNSANCDSAYYGFFNQVYNAARQFKRYAQSPTNWGYRAGRSNYIQYHPNAACGGSNVFIQNQATAGLYIYTPYQPNSTALSNIYGGQTDGCSSYGNRNFWRLFHEWFGTTYANCIYPMDNQGQTYRLLQPNTNSYFLTSTPSEVCYATGKLGYIFDGVLFYPKSGVESPVYRLEKAGKYFYTASAAERDSAARHHGFRIEGLAFYASTTSQSGTLKPVYRLNYPPTGGYMYTLSATERDAMTGYGFKAEGIAFYAHNNADITLHDIHRLSHPTSGYLFTASTTERNGAIANYGFRSEGVGFKARAGFSTDSLPAYRLTSGKGYLYTASFGERKRALQLGYRSEGMGFFVYPTSNLGASKQIHRLAHPNGNYLYTASTDERNSAVSKYGYRYEGIVYRTH